MEMTLEIAIFDILSKYFLQILIFSSIGSSDKSIICELNRGFPFSLWKISLASISPSIQGSKFFAQWSVWRITVAPYNSASSCTCFAPAIAPAMAEFWLWLESPFPELNCAPPLENWIITGLLSSLAVSRTALILLLPITLTAGKAKIFF